MKFIVPCIKSFCVFNDDDDDDKEFHPSLPLHALRRIKINQNQCATYVCKLNFQLICLFYFSLSYVFFIPSWAKTANRANIGRRRWVVQKRKTLRASLAMQRQYNVGLNSTPGTISLAVDKNRYSRLGPRGPERAWPGEPDALRNRRFELDHKGYKKPMPPRYTSAFTSDVSHLVV